MQMDAIFSGPLFKWQVQEMSGNMVAALRAGYLYRGYEHWLSGDEESIHGEHGAASNEAESDASTKLVVVYSLNKQQTFLK